MNNYNNEAPLSRGGSPPLRPPPSESPDAQQLDAQLEAGGWGAGGTLALHEGIRRKKDRDKAARAAAFLSTCPGFAPAPGAPFPLSAPVQPSNKKRVEKGVLEILRPDGADAVVTSNHRCCAERRLIGHWVEQARKKGVPRAKIIAWVRRKMGSDISVWRHTSDGAYGCSVPCPLCARVLIQFDVTVHCYLGEGRWYRGRLTDPGAPEGKPTTFQRLHIFKTEEKSLPRAPRVAKDTYVKPKRRNNSSGGGGRGDREYLDWRREEGAGAGDPSVAELSIRE